MSAGVRVSNRRKRWIGGMEALGVWATAAEVSEVGRELTKKRALETLLMAAGLDSTYVLALDNREVRLGVAQRRGVVALQASQAGKGTGKALEDQRGLMPVIAGVSWTEKVRGSRKESLVQPLAAAAKGVMGLLLEENWGRGS
ncbi:hypothetical protein E2562_031642 [Oryza meyeriana var. granulata]|uniref:Uncharacterized protein n=1 Tax=Oryza meyeriana var. granulata TaxID=110450 RepID=A0A6G1D9R9_9ORYZ|nr:hypothetical protein E2562_031642 [Oryza meyeriana var. granulata]